MSRTWLPFVAKIACSFGLLAVVLMSVDGTALLAHGRALRPDLTVLVLLLFYPTQLYAALRWYLLLRGLGGTVSYGSVVRITFLGQVAALFLPGQLSGDLVRAVAVTHQQQEPAEGLLSIALDKLSVLCALMLFAAVGSLASPTLARLPGLVIAALALALCSALVLVAFARYRSPRLAAWMAGDAVPAPVRRLAHRIGAVFVLPRLGWPMLALLVLSACGLQLLNTIGGFVLASAIGISIGPLEFAAVNAVVALAQVLPISVGGLGVREGAFVLLLSLYGVSQAHATAYSLVLFGLLALLVVAGWLCAEGLTALHRSSLARRSRSAA